MSGVQVESPVFPVFKIDAKAFLSTGNQFRLGCLETEACHPLTANLQRLSVEELELAIKTMRQVDLNALVKLNTSAVLSQISELSDTIARVIDSEKRIFIFGCGATGRLSVAVENLCKRGLVPFGERVVGFMSGGDCALVKSIESFEDHEEWGRRQLKEVGFQDGDLLISSSEGGETSIVIGCALAASELSSETPYFLYCNLGEMIVKKIDRSARIIANEHVKKICLAVGPMALSGSTRLQASTVLMLAIAVALRGGDASVTIGNLIDFYRSLDCNFLAKYIEAEEAAYRDGDMVVYRSNGIDAFTIMTDLTERCPTFSLKPFERHPDSGLSKSDMCLAYLAIRDTSNPRDAWRKLLLRSPNCLDWEFCRHLTAEDVLYRFDISESVIAKRTKVCAQHIFDISSALDGTTFSFCGYTDTVQLAVSQLPETSKLIYQSIMLKMLINIHSTLLMGRLERYKSNVMTFVAPTNFKLIDRAARYAQQILRVEHNIKVPYEAIVYRMESVQDSVADHDGSIVNTVVKSYLSIS